MLSYGSSSESYVPFKIASGAQDVSTRDIIIAGVTISVAILWSALAQIGRNKAGIQYIPV